MLDLDKYLSRAEQVALLQERTGTKVRFQAYDEVIKVMLGDDRSGIQIRRWKITERATETILTEPRTVTQVWACDNEQWSFVAEAAWPDNECEQQVIFSHYGGKTVDEWRDALYWDTLAARPGNRTRFGQRDYSATQKYISKLWNRTLGESDYQKHYVGEE